LSTTDVADWSLSLVRTLFASCAAGRRNVHALVHCDRQLNTIVDTLPLLAAPGYFRFRYDVTASHGVAAARCRYRVDCARVAWVYDKRQQTGPAQGARPAR